MSHRESEKPCRACTDFRTYAKLQKEAYNSEKVLLSTYIYNL